MFMYIASGPGTSRILDAVLSRLGNAHRMPATINPLELIFTLYDYDNPEVTYKATLILDGPVYRLSDHRVSKWHDQPGYKFDALLVDDDGTRRPCRSSTG